MVLFRIDKGGDAELFRKFQAAFEIIREVFDKKKITTFSVALSTPVSETPTTSYYESSGFSAPIPTWEWYSSASEEPIPLYKVYDVFLLVFHKSWLLFLVLFYWSASLCIQKSPSHKLPLLFFNFQ